MNTTGTVTIELSEYNRLVDLEKSIKGDFTFCLEQEYFGFRTSKYTVIGENEVIRELYNQVYKLEKENTKLKESQKEKQKELTFFQRLFKHW